MPRRNQHKKTTNKRHRKGSFGGRDDSHGAATATNNNNSSKYEAAQATSLEEDLRLQRIRQQERQKLREMEQDEKMEKDRDEDCDNNCNHDVGYEQPQTMLLFGNDDGTMAMDIAGAAITKTRHLIIKGTVLPASTAPLRRTVNPGSNAGTNANGSGNDEYGYHKSFSSLSSPLPPSVVSLPPSFLLRHIEQTSPLLAMHKRNTLRKLWPVQHHLESMVVQPRAASLYCKTKWPQYTSLESSSSSLSSYNNSELKCSWDLSCKHRLHPSARTFDVAMLDTHTHTHTHDYQSSSECASSLSSSTPTIATIFQDGWGLLRQQSQHKINTIKAPPAYAIRMHESSKTCGMIVRSVPNSSNRHMSPYSFRWYPLPHATSYVEAHLPRPVTDFCFGKEIALFSCPRYSGRSNNNSESLNPLFMPLVEAGGIESNSTTNNYYSSDVRTINVRNFPQSDALRIEMMCQEQEKLLGFGHRNGQVSILDLRATGTVCSILQCEDKTSGQSLGSVSDLGFIPTTGCFGQQHQILVKRSFGSCQLHDLRKSTSKLPLSSDASYHTSTTVVCNMTVPANEINPMLSANCNGFFVDPNSYQTMMSPYIANPSGDARLGVWSLDTGVMVGSRLLQKKNKEGFVAAADREAERNSSLHVELCSKTTPLVSSEQQQRHKGDHDGIDASSSSCSFGVW
eukprot:CAMPEP_0168177620 /NCGR_PEP_ID=MMETSP0139_2-20121125/8574_1 /TAXON_ID=44445 /ORGANISM="Pseudo-nitzschia australis, Strain 10249 10 AB" /LENGTH=680 /DNA_ID=CAMNT_0008096729 /DNA_START=455 /DNA_END=2494 /DNA_ORIENTATION=-